MATQFRYQVQRAIQGGTPHSWAKGDGLFNTGGVDDGFIDLYALMPISETGGGAQKSGPAIAFMERTGTAWNAIEHRAVVGNLKGTYDYPYAGAAGTSPDIFGLAAGNPSGSWIAADPVNGLRLMDGTKQFVSLNALGLIVGKPGEAQGIFGEDYIALTNGLGSEVFRADSSGVSIGANGYIKVTDNAIDFKRANGSSYITLNANGLTADTFKLEAGRIALDSIGTFTIKDAQARQRVILKDGTLPDIRSYGVVPQGGTSLVPNASLDSITNGLPTGWTFARLAAYQGDPISAQSYAGANGGYVTFGRNNDQENPDPELLVELSTDFQLDNQLNKAIEFEAVVGGVPTSAASTAILPAWDTIAFIVREYSASGGYSKTVQRVVQEGELPSNAAPLTVPLTVVPKSNTTRITITMRLNDNKASATLNTRFYGIQVREYVPRSIITSEGALFFSDSANYMKFGPEGGEAMFTKLRFYDEATGRQGKIIHGASGWQIVDA